MAKSSKSKRVISFKVSDEMYDKLEKHAERMGLSVSDCVIELLHEQIDNVETYYKMLEIDEEMDKVSFASNN